MSDAETLRALRNEVESEMRGSWHSLYFWRRTAAKEQYEPLVNVWLAHADASAELLRWAIHLRRILNGSIR